MVAVLFKVILLKDRCLPFPFLPPFPCFASALLD